MLEYIQHYNEKSNMDKDVCACEYSKYIHIYVR